MFWNDPERQYTGPTPFAPSGFFYGMYPAVELTATSQMNAFTGSGLAYDADGIALQTDVSLQTALAGIPLSVRGRNYANGLVIAGDPYDTGFFTYTVSGTDSVGFSNVTFTH